MTAQERQMRRARATIATKREMFATQILTGLLAGWRPIFGPKSAVHIAVKMADELFNTLYLPEQVEEYAPPETEEEV